MRQSEPERFRLKYEIQIEGPFDAESLFGFLRPRGLPGIEEVTETEYRRVGEVGIRFVKERGVLEVEGRREEEPRIRRLFDLNAPTEIIHRKLKQRNGLRVPGCWDPFELAVRAVLGQQVSVAAATTVAGRLVEHLGSFRPEAFVDLDVAFLPRARAATLRGLAGFVLSGGSYERLEEVKGIGPWTQQYVRMRALEDRDAFPSGDLVLRRAAGVETAEELERMAEQWRPYRAYAAMYLWQFGSMSSRRPSGG